MKSVIIERKEVAISITKITCKIYKLGLYNKVVNDSIYSRCQKKAIEKELQNLESYQT